MTPEQNRQKLCVIQKAIRKAVESVVQKHDVGVPLH
jgi:hypothetical protein